MTKHSNQFVDHNLVNDKFLRPWSAFFWGLYSERSYARNSHRAEFTLCMVFFFALMLGPTYPLYYYFPLKFTVVPFFFGPLLACLLMPVIYCNMSFICSLTFLAVSTYCYFQHWNLGITLFTFHLEHYIFTAFLITSILGLVRRGWNAYVWWQLDRITLRYCRKNNIAISERA